MQYVTGLYHGCFFVGNYEPRFCLAYSYIHHSHRLYGVLRIWNVLVLYQIAYYNVYSALWHHVVLCVDHTKTMMEASLYYKKINIFVRNISILLNMILPLCLILFTCPFFVFALINRSIFACCMIQVLFKFSDKNIIRCTSSSVHYHLFFLPFFSWQLYSWHQL